MENQQQILIETQFEGLTLYVRPHETHEWLMETKLVAEGYGISEEVIRNHKSRNSKDFKEEKHFISVTNCYANPRAGIAHIQTFWTKRGVIRLGFFIKSDRARLFRDWAEDLIIRELEKTAKNGWIEAINQLETKMHNYIGALYEMLGKHIKENKKDIQEMKGFIHNLAARVDKIEAHLFKPHQLPEQKAYTYLMRKTGKNEYKIGKSIHPNKRKKELQIAGDEIEVITTIRFNTEEHALLWENTLKEYFNHRKIRGEWFSLVETEVAFILEVAKAFEKLA